MVVGVNITVQMLKLLYTLQPTYEILEQMKEYLDAVGEEFSDVGEADAGGGAGDESGLALDVHRRREEQQSGAKRRRAQLYIPFLRTRPAPSGQGSLRQRFYPS